MKWPETAYAAFSALKCSRRPGNGQNESIMKLPIERNEIYRESCMKTMARMPDNFVDCIITSPPYYGLRSYGTEPQVWGGDPGCKHRWKKIVTKRPNAAGGKNSGELDWQKEAAHFVDYHTRETVSHLCGKCDAWKGELGQEPDPFRYIQNICIVMAECYRVLKPTGTLFVNIDDSNCPSGGQHVSGSRGKTSQLVSKNEKAVPDSGRQIRKAGAMKLGLKPKSLMAIPALFQVAMIYDLGFLCRSVPIWWKRSAQPSSAKDTFTCDYEPIYFFTKTGKYWFETQYERAKGIYQNKGSKKVNHPDSNRSVPTNRAGDPDDGLRIVRTVMDVNTANGDDRDGTHYAAYPLELCNRFIKAGCPERVCIHCDRPYGITPGRNPKNFICKCKAEPETKKGLVYDPFGGTGTTAIVAHRLGADFISSELQPDYHAGAEKRVSTETVRGRLF